MVHGQAGTGTLSRRDLLRYSATGALGAALTGATIAPAAASRESSQVRSCIVIFAEGGPSHLDTWDPKPEAPSEYRGPFGAVETNVPGVRICEHLPRMARLADKLTILRGLTHNEEHHERASRLMHSRFLGPSLPELESTGPLPGYVSLGAPLRGMPGGHEPFVISPNGRETLVDRVRHARRLVEGGTRLVTITHPGWDTHGNAFSQLKDHLLPELDLAFSTLITDLSDRGLLEETHVLWMGEFGRTPRINDWGGRDHHSACFSAVVAGGEQSGTVIGASKDRGMEPVTSPLSPGDFAQHVRA